MKECRDLFVVDDSLEEAFDRLFQAKEMNEWMQQSTTFTVGDWKRDERTFQVVLDANNPVVAFLGGGKLTGTIKQKVQRGEKKMVIQHKVRPHMVGAELLKIRPVIELTVVDANKTGISLYTRVDAVMPPPLNQMVENAIIVFCNKNNQLFKEFALRDKKMTRDGGSLE